MCARSVPLLTPLLSTREPCFPTQHPLAHGIHPAPSRDTIIGLKGSTNWLVNIHENQNITFHLNLRVTLIFFFKVCIDVCFPEDKRMFWVFFILGTTNLKKAVTLEHGVVWGIDIALNYLKEINNASCPWRTTSVRRVIGLCLLVRDLVGAGGLSRHPEFEKKIYTIGC